MRQEMRSGRVAALAGLVLAGLVLAAGCVEKTAATPAQGAQPAAATDDAAKATAAQAGLPAGMNLRVARLSDAPQVLAQMQQQMQGQAASGSPPGFPPLPPPQPVAIPEPPGLGGGLSGGGLPDEARQRATALIEELYGLLAGGPVDVVEVRPESGVLRVVFRVRNSQLPPQTVHVSADGRLLFQGALDARERLVKVQMDRNFAECARLRGLRVFGDPRQAETQKQLAEFGEFGAAVLIDCSVGEGNCARIGVKQLPAVAFRERVEPGPKPRAYLESLTGCK